MVLQNSCVLTAVPTAHTCTTLLLYLRTFCYRVRGTSSGHQSSSFSSQQPHFSTINNNPQPKSHP